MRIVESSRRKRRRRRRPVIIACIDRSIQSTEYFFVYFQVATGTFFRVLLGQILEYAVIAVGRFAGRVATSGQSGLGLILAKEATVDFCWPARFLDRMCRVAAVATSSRHCATVYRPAATVAASAGCRRLKHYLVVVFIQ